MSGNKTLPPVQVELPLLPLRDVAKALNLGSRMYSSVVILDSVYSLLSQRVSKSTVIICLNGLLILLLWFFLLSSRP